MLMAGRKFTIIDVLLIVLLVAIFEAIFLSHRNQNRQQSEPSVPMKSQIGSPLPGYCARCTNDLVQEAKVMKKCNLLNNSISLWKTDRVIKDDAVLKAWLGTQLSSMPFLTISRNGTTSSLVSEDEVDYQQQNNFYFRYLTNDGVRAVGLEQYTHYWRLDNHGKPLCDDISRFEKPIEYGKLETSFKEGEKQRFQEHAPWYPHLDPDKLRSEYSPNPDFALLNFESNAKAWRALVKATYQTDNNYGMMNDVFNITPQNYFYTADAIRKYLALDRYKGFVNGKRGIVIGSQSPWLELEIMRAGAGHLTTVEYLNLTAFIPPGHPHMAHIHPKALEKQMMEGKLEPYDFAASYSSLEHAGLGRYGDPLNPDGDLMELAKLACLVKPGGFLFFGVPAGIDSLQLNLHRIYGLKRYSLVGECWHLVEYDPEMVMTWGAEGATSGIYQPWFIFQNLRGCAL